VEGVDSFRPLFFHGTAVVGFDIYVIGGKKGFLADIIRSCSCFNAVTKTYREVAPMHECR
jgi:kelch-like protein 10